MPREPGLGQACLVSPLLLCFSRDLKQESGVLGLGFGVQPWYCGDGRVGQGERGRTIEFAVIRT